MSVSNLTKPVPGKTKPVAPSVKSPKEEAVSAIHSTSLEPPSPEVHPFAHLSGKYDDEPLWDAYIAAIQQYRQEANEQEDTTE